MRHDPITIYKIQNTGFSNGTSWFDVIHVGKEGIFRNGVNAIEECIRLNACDQIEDNKYRVVKETTEVWFEPLELQTS